MRLLPALLLFLAATSAVGAQQDNLHRRSAIYEAPTDPLVVEKLDDWQDLKFGMLIHWGLYAVPVYEALLDWAAYEQRNNLSSGAIGKALHYAKDQLPRLQACFENGRLEVDNNLIDHAVAAKRKLHSPAGPGRKNYLFAGSHAGAQRAAVLYSFFASCKRLEVSPRAWLRDVLDRLPDHPVNRLVELLPGTWTQATAETHREEE